MKIPKTIHYCWFGGNQLDEKSIKCIESWKKIMPDYEIIRWDESNYDINKHPFLKEAYDNKKWAFVSDYARLDIIYNYGGIYLDTDVEVIKSFDEFLDKNCFMGIEKGSLCVATGLGFGAAKGNKFIKENLEYYDDVKIYNKNNNMNLINCPIITSKLLKKYGFKQVDENQIIDNIYIYSSNYFCPMDYETGEISMDVNTYSIHLYNMTWLSKYDVKLCQLKRYCVKKIGKKYGKYLYSIISLPLKILKRVNGWFKK